MQETKLTAADKQEWIKPEMTVVALVSDVASGATVGDEGFTATECGDGLSGIPGATCS